LLLFSYWIFQALSRAFIAIVETITLIGAHLIFVETDADTYHLFASALEAFILKNYRLGSDGHSMDGGSGQAVT